MDNWIPTRKEALRRLETFLPRAGRSYARLRNYDRGPGRHVDVSQLSPWIRHRLILEEEVAAAVLARHSFSAAEKFVQEVFWRTYWKGWLELRPGVWQDYRSRVRASVGELDRDPDLRRRWEDATCGRSGIAPFDAWSRELRQTGYLHNHARMWFASIWIFTLELPWELGADFFLRHLLDGDPASNTLSWRWVGGLQTRGKTYLARADNIARYTEGRFPARDGLSRGGLARSAPPLPGDAHPKPRAAPQSVAWDRDLPTGLLLTEEDLHPDFLFDGGVHFQAVAALRATWQRSPLEVDPKVRRFADGGLADALARLKGSAPQRSEPAETSGPILDWARDAGLRQVVTPYVPVGPTADALADVAKALAAHDIQLVPVLRDWDRRAWPLATRGFFQFKEQIPNLISDLRRPAVSAS